MRSFYLERDRTQNRQPLLLIALAPGVLFLMFAKRPA
jgi:hypothetical protein